MRWRVVPSNRPGVKEPVEKETVRRVAWREANQGAQIILYKTGQIDTTLVQLDRCCT